MHALGFFHEHSRPDRDDYISIVPGNMVTDIHERNFRKLPRMATFGLPYDLESLLHYGPELSKSPDKPAIAPIAKTPSRWMGQQYGLSLLDVARLKAAYNCIQKDVTAERQRCPRPVCPDTNEEKRITAVWLSRNARTWASINNATVYATLRDTNNLLFDSQTAITNAFGEFTLSVPVTTRVEGNVSMEPLLWINKTSAGNGTANGRLLYMKIGDCDVDTPASTLNVNIRYGLNNISGPIFATTTSNEDGYWSQSLPAGYYTATVSAAGYLPKTFSVVVCAGGSSNIYHSLMPLVSYDDIRIIHFDVRSDTYMKLVVEGPLQDSQQRTRVECLGTRLSADNLIHTDYAGAYADSTLIKKQLPGMYRISVYDWNNRKGAPSRRLVNSNSVVEIYRGKNLWARFFVPNRVGNTWNVAEFNGVNLTAINELTTEFHDA
ncbi:zinc metalloproteinase nas-39-like isoform X2 [Paramacrobiotus metropolitanus]|uniref:zinc metalloproteinase nas-39-like isoform X2 n=1 Tax=Paramacrobiotus metropolitanus TaxID=2943436 RepID=UPI002445B163|nr:zinc metalloproteinase nas-39-like isoform X2 [Paramacrobiotus metropolitanus]